MPLVPALGLDANAQPDRVPVEPVASGTGHAETGIEPRRVALVIGNEDYRDDPLASPVNDARAISAALESRGFEVMRQENLDAQGMQTTLREFSRRLDAGGIGLFYFAGHGLQVRDRTLLVPVDADERFPARLLTHGMDLHAILEAMSRPRPDKLNIVILDACLDNPFGNPFGTPSATPAASLPETAQQTIVAYATRPGAPAAEDARHGLYTAALLQAIADPDLDIEAMLHLAAGTVLQRSKQRQLPWMASSLSSRFAFTGAAQGKQVQTLALTGQEAASALRSRGVIPKDSAEQYELTFWDSIKDSTHASDYEAYLQAYPNGRFAALAKARIARLRAAAPKAETPQEEAQPATKAAPPTQPAPKPAERARSAPARKAAPERASPAPAAPSQAEAPPSTAGRVSELKDCPECPALIGLPHGTFTMGSNASDPSEKPAHQVTIRTPFAIGKYEVTVAQWNACADAGGCPKIAGDTSQGANMPMRNVSWDDTQQYMKWLGKVSGKPYRLPTEAEWEFAARGGTSTRYWWGEQMSKGKANCKECGGPWHPEGPENVGSFAPNPYGLYDMNGSVWEWVSDCWHNSFKGAPGDGRAWNDPNCRVRVIRGGSWREGASYMPVTTRFKYDASVRQAQNGFRVARDLK
ncbi:SUMF1/EgtB/PvdO family nonheme iron enzyme [Noviherbaspirillum massiliense]|uniref:SUMF1/EgtB/PvdO family nonheme iron enzyme n=1 Tax=Noviherbaspirillum massiliense TaxID=1465823 RepID=UPI0002E9BC5D|nr:SUMF1/EgtB/PvdO family nonheme iron enzyme [Noviherbaspirillum massiliense]